MIDFEQKVLTLWQKLHFQNTSRATHQTLVWHKKRHLSWPRLSRWPRYSNFSLGWPKIHVYTVYALWKCVTKYLTQKRYFIFAIQVTWIISDSEGERREKGEVGEDGLPVFDLGVGDNEKVKHILIPVNKGKVLAIQSQQYQTFQPKVQQKGNIFVQSVSHQNDCNPCHHNRRWLWLARLRMRKEKPPILSPCPFIVSANIYFPLNCTLLTQLSCWIIYGSKDLISVFPFLWDWSQTLPKLTLLKENWDLFQDFFVVENPLFFTTIPGDLVESVCLCRLRQNAAPINLAANFPFMSPARPSKTNAVYTHFEHIKNL